MVGKESTRKKPQVRVLKTDDKLSRRAGASKRIRSSSTTYPKLDTRDDASENRLNTSTGQRAKRATSKYAGADNLLVIPRAGGP